MELICKETFKDMVILELSCGIDQEDIFEISKIIDRPEKIVRLDLLNCTRIRSASIGYIIALHKKFEEQGRALILENVPKNIKIYLDCIGLSKVFNIK